MKDKLLEYYESELKFLRELGSEFARKYPKIAGRLRMEADAIEDPHVSRFIEASALLAARTRLKIDDEFPEICQAILQTLYPQYLAPFPPTAIIEASLKDKAFDNVNGYKLPKGAKIESEPIEGEPCRFHTCYETQVWPIEVQQVEYFQPPFPFEASPWIRDVQAAIRVRLVASSPKINLSTLNVSTLRFFLGGSNACSNALAEALFTRTLGAGLVAVGAKSGGGRVGAAQRTSGTEDSAIGDSAALWLPVDQIEPVGYGDDHNLLPYEDRSLLAYRLLSEFFAASEKFRFVDVKFDRDWKQTNATGAVDLIFYLRTTYPVLQRELDKNSLRIGCTPIVNLFEKRTEPIRLSNNVTEYRVIPSARGAAGNEIYSIDRVTALSPRGEYREFLPFFEPNHASDASTSQHSWYARRVRSLGTTSEEDRGTEVYVSIVDLHGQPLDSDEEWTVDGWTMDVVATCLNRDRVADLPMSDGQPRLALFDGGAALNIQRITPMTRTLRSIDRDDLHWRLVSHLTLNHLILTNSGDRGAESLKEILRLYNPDDSAETRKMIDSVAKVAYGRGVARVVDPQMPLPGFCRGVEVELELDEERLGGSSPVLLAMILERFFGLFATLNSYTRTRVKAQGRDEPILQGKVRAGTQTLL